MDIVAPLFLTADTEVIVYDKNGAPLVYDKAHLTRIGTALARPLFEAAIQHASQD